MKGLTFRVTEEEYSKVTELARKSGLSLSAYVRAVVLDGAGSDRGETAQALAEIMAKLESMEGLMTGRQAEAFKAIGRAAVRAQFGVNALLEKTIGSEAASGLMAKAANLTDEHFKKLGL
jgi:predicted HicB family RNase H-like nuclease